MKINNQKSSRRAAMQRWPEKGSIYQFSKFKLLRHRLNKKEVLFASRLLDKPGERTLFRQIARLHKQVDELEWQLMTPEQKARFRTDKESMWKKFESSAGGFVVIKQGQEIP